METKPAGLVVGAEPLACQFCPEPPSSPELGEAQETLPVDYSGPSMQICFNAQYVLDFLAAVTTDVVSLDLKDEVSQAVMKPVGAEGYDYTYVIMPMRV